MYKIYAWYFCFGFFFSSVLRVTWLFQPKELAGKLHDDLTQQKLASLDSAKAFVKMLRSFRNSGTKAISEVFSSPDSYYIVYVFLHSFSFSLFFYLWCCNCCLFFFHIWCLRAVVLQSFGCWSISITALSSFFLLIRFCFCKLCVTDAFPQQ